MTQPVNFVAASHGHVRFGIAEDPAAQVADWQRGNPHPIELLAGWIVPPHERARMLANAQRAVRKTRVQRTPWFGVDPDEAVRILGHLAGLLGGQPWKLRRHPRKAHDHASARPVSTPHGVFPSANAAARALGITRQAVSGNALRRAFGWRYLDDPTSM
jgi:hypothetical protein